MRVLQNFRSFGYGYGSLTGFTEVPGIVTWAYRTHRSSGWVQKTLYSYPVNCVTERTELTEVPGTGMNVLQNFQKFRVLWYGRAELPEVPGRYRNAVPVPRLLWYGRTDPTQVPGTGMNVVPNSQKFFLRVSMLYRAHRGSG